jgi:ATP-dependent Zn protease
MLARDMVARFGMAEEVAPMRLFASDSSAYLGEETPLADVASETKAAADLAIRRLMQEAITSAQVLLEHHRSLLDDFAGVLVEHETLEGVPLQEQLDDLQSRMKPVGRGGVRAKGVSTAKNVNGQVRKRRTTVG